MSSFRTSRGRRRAAIRVVAISGALLVVALFAGAPLGAQGYDPVGPQTGVDVATVEAGGWRLCFASPYASRTGFWFDAIQAGCTGTDLMLACAPVGESTLTLLAQGPHADVIADTGPGRTDSHLVNGSQWYRHTNTEHSGEQSWGFADPEDEIDRWPCDYLDKEDSHRLCWHLDRFQGGYRCGATLDLHESSAWEKRVYNYTPWIAHDDFESGDLCAWHAAVGSTGVCDRTLTLDLAPACNSLIEDDGPGDLSPDPGVVAYRLSWNELAPETAVRLQIDRGPEYLLEDDWVELAPGTTQSAIFTVTSPTEREWTYRVVGHFGHEPGHGATPIAGDIVSNPCTVLVLWGD